MSMKMLLAIAVAMFGLSACASTASWRDGSRDPQNIARQCVANGWLHDGTLSPEQFGYLVRSGIDDYRKRYGTNPPASPPDMMRIQQQCQ